MAKSVNEANFIAGFAAAVSTLVRLYDEPTLARDVCTSNGFDLRDFGAAEIEQYDFELIQQAFGRRKATPRRKRKNPES